MVKFSTKWEKFSTIGVSFSTLFCEFSTMDYEFFTMIFLCKPVLLIPAALRQSRTLIKNQTKKIAPYQKDTVLKKFPYMLLTNQVNYLQIKPIKPQNFPFNQYNKSSAQRYESNHKSSVKSSTITKISTTIFRTHHTNKSSAQIKQ